MNLSMAQEALENNFVSGSTATVIVLFDGKILVANVGDSKAILFSEIPSNQGLEGLDFLLFHIALVHTFDN